MEQDIHNEWIIEMQKEMGVFYSSNLLLTVRARFLEKQIVSLQERIDNLTLCTKEQDKTIASLQEQIAPGRKENRKVRNGKNSTTRQTGN